MKQSELDAIREKLMSKVLSYSDYINLALDKLPDALSEIDRLTSENETLTKDKNRLSSKSILQQETIIKLQAENERLKQERDNAVSRIKRRCDTCEWYKTHGFVKQPKCEKQYEPSACFECVNWEWDRKAFTPSDT